MGDYFKPLRRKLGVVTLVMACVLTGAWMRSTVAIDGFAITLPKNRYSVRSYNHQILWDHQHVDQGKLYHPFFDSLSMKIDKDFKFSDPRDRRKEGDKMVAFGDFYILRGKRFAGFKSHFVPTPGPAVPFLEVRAQTPYWSIVAPLTLLSAWLLFSKPRSKSTSPEVDRG